MYAIYAYIGGVWGVNVFITQTLHETAIGLPIRLGVVPKGGQCRRIYTFLFQSHGVYGE